MGKTTTAVNLAAALAIAEKKTLLVDWDPQGNATTGMGVERNLSAISLYNAVTGKAGIREAVVPSEMPYLETAPSGADLLKVEFDHQGVKDKEYLLRNALRDVSPSYDYIVVDPPPSLGLLSLNALAAADLLVIPLQCEFFALEGLSRFIFLVNKIRGALNPSLEIAGILLTMLDEQERISAQIAEKIRCGFGDLVFKTAIPRNRHVKEFGCKGKPLLFQKLSPEARSYCRVAQEFLERKGNGNEDHRCRSHQER